MEIKEENLRDDSQLYPEINKRTNHRPKKLCETQWGECTEKHGKKSYQGLQKRRTESHEGRRKQESQSANDKR
jgi:hypothetical protein